MRSRPPSTAPAGTFTVTLVFSVESGRRRTRVFVQPANASSKLRQQGKSTMEKEYALFEKSCAKAFIYPTPPPWRVLDI
jgi:hypothetical protein